MADPKAPKPQSLASAGGVSSAEQTVKSSPVIFYLGALVLGFIAGFGAAKMLCMFICPGSGPPSVKPHTLIVTRVEQAPGVAAKDYRLRIVVNNQPYSYPTDKVWGTYGASPDDASFLLPQADQYVIQMKAFTPDPVATSETQTVSASDTTEKRFHVGSLLVVKYQVR
jgi:hypothetical protein